MSISKLKSQRTFSQLVLGLTAVGLLAGGGIVSAAAADEGGATTTRTSGSQLRAGEKVSVYKAKAGKCYIRKNRAAGLKTTFRHVSCGDAKHNVEVFWAGKTKVGKHASLKKREQRAIKTCTTYYRSINNGVNKPYMIYLPTTKRQIKSYGSRAVCFYAGKPSKSLKPLGTGWHVLGR